MKVELIYNARAALGEGPVWDHDRNRLIWVDIEEGRIHFTDPSSGNDKYTEVGTRISMAVPNKEGFLIGTLQDGFAWILEKYARYSPRDQVVDGRLVSWAEVGACLGWVGGLWCGAAAALGCAILRRRELAKVQV